MEGKTRYREIFSRAFIKHDSNDYIVKKCDKLLLDTFYLNIKYIQLLMSVFDESNRRLFAGFLSSSLVRGGDKYISKITGLDMKTIRKGRNELVYGDKILKNRVRRVGGGRYSKERAEKEYVKELFALIDDDIAGNPMNDSRWVRRTLRWIKSEIHKKGIKVSISTIRKTLIGSKISLKKNAKTKSTQSHPLRNDQFLYLNKMKKEFLAAGKPVISIDTKKKELIGNFKNPGKTWRNKAYETLDHDFPSLAEGKFIPFGIYDIKLNKGYLYCGTSIETSEFVVDSIVQWWSEIGQKEYPNQHELLILCDNGGANGYRRRGWKWELQNKLADQFNLTVTICHYPSGCSKWNPIEHRLFSFISINWQGEPLTSHDKALNLIRSTKTEKGLIVEAQLLDKVYQRGIKIADSQMASLKLEKKQICPQWNYTLSPRGSYH